MKPASTLRDPLAALVAYNARFMAAGRDPKAVREKLDRLCASSFGFLRGTFHLFVADWPSYGDDPLLAGPPQPIVGDLHLENFGAFRAADGAVVFDVNDFDETGPGTPALDLARLATSIVLADDKHGEARAVERILGLAGAWLAAARSSEMKPLSGKEPPPVVRALLAAADEASRAPWLERRIEGGAGQRRFKTSDKYERVPDGALRAAIAAGVRDFGRHCVDRPAGLPDWPEVLDVAVRRAGTGSLGRFRWAVLIQGKSGKLGRERILELKEALPSPLTPNPVGDPAEQVITAERRLQGASPAYLGVAHVGELSCTVRELQPTEAKIDASAMNAPDLDALSAACGTALGRLHLRGDAALAVRIEGRDRGLCRRLAAFALRYAEVVTDDHARLCAQRSEVERALGLS